MAAQKSDKKGLASGNHVSHQVAGSHDERMLSMMIPIIELALKNDKSKEQSKVIDKLSTFINPARWVYRIVVAALGIIAVISTVGIIVLASNPDVKEIPDGLVALGSGCIGALGGLLANRAS